jgi:phospholipid transport system transporter-binding protein
VSSARIEAATGGFRISGALTFATVRDALRAAEAQFKSVPSWEIDLSAVTAVDSAGLALLIEWYRWAERDRKPLRFVGVPAQLRALAKISDVDKLLPLNG